MDGKTKAIVAHITWIGWLISLIINSSQKETIKIEYKMNWFQKIFFWIGFGSFIVIILFFILRYFMKGKKLWL